MGDGRDAAMATVGSIDQLDGKLMGSEETGHACGGGGGDGMAAALEEGRAA